MSNERAMMSPIVSEWRAFFAPVNRATGVPAIFDPGQIASFDLDAPPDPWLAAGAITNLKRTPGTKVLQMRGGKAGASSTQFRASLDARLEFEFRDWGKLQMAIAGGGEHMNVLATAGGQAPSGGTAVPPIIVLAGSTAAKIIVGAAIVSTFNVGDLVAVDVDYAGQTGYVGTGVAGAYVRSSIGLGADYVRRVTFNVERIASKTDDSLVLSRPLIGGAPASGAKVQLVSGFVDREGSSFMQEWSALFMSDSCSGGRVCYYYPRLQACASATETAAEIADTLRGMMLHANLTALPHADSNDGQQCLCWRSYIPAPCTPAF